MHGRIGKNACEGWCMGSHLFDKKLVFGPSKEGWVLRGDVWVLAQGMTPEFDKTVV